jgi:prepilin-type N-terminal cleavage/methylation domain-containing protein
MRTTDRSRGFTLLEMMTVVAILMILATVAVYSYKSYLRRARTGEATAMLLDIKMKQETYFMTYSRYVDTGAEGGVDGFYPQPYPLDYVPHPWLASAATWDCANPSDDHMKGFCALGITPTTQDTWFQYVTLGWEPGDAAPSPWIRDGTRRWWFARARGYLLGVNQQPYELRLSSEQNEIIEVTQ